MSGTRFDLVRTVTAFWQSRTLAVAVELDLFSTLARQPATLDEVCDRLRLHPQPTEALLNGLHALGVLELEGGVYRNGESASAWLDRANPGYLGGLFAQADWQFPLWTRLRELLETGEAQGGRAGVQDGGLEHGSEDTALREHVAAADALAAGCGPALAAAVDWSGRRRAVDLGGARGAVLAGILDAHPHLTGASFDLPPVAPLFDEHVRGLGLGDRMSFHAGDFFSDDLPAADVYLLGHLLSDLDGERCAGLVARAAAALPPGGLLVVYDTLVDPAREETWQNWLVSLNAQLVHPGGTVHSTADCRVWLTEAGLVDVRAAGLVDAVTVVTGVRPA